MHWKMPSICIYFVTADNWIRVLPVILAFKSLWYRLICIYEIFLVFLTGKCSQYVCVFSPPILVFEYLTTLLMWAAFIHKEFFDSLCSWDVSWYFSSIFLWWKSCCWWQWDTEMETVQRANWPSIRCPWAQCIFSHL